MKITSFNPLIVTKDAEPIVRLFEELGFERHHQPTGTSGVGNSFVGYRMKDANGFYVDITQSSAERSQDLTSIRMNVDNYDEVYQLLVDRGFKSVTGDKTTETGSAKADMLVSPSGFTISLIQHIKHD